MPVSAVRDGYTAKQATELRSGYSFEESFQAGDLSVHMFRHFMEYFPAAIVPRTGGIAMLEPAWEPAIGEMTSGLDVEEKATTRADPKAVAWCPTAGNGTRCSRTATFSRPV